MPTSMRSLTRRLFSRSRVSPRPHRTRLQLEALETLLVPAAYHWTGAISTVWTDVQNWTEDTGAAVTNYPGAVAGADDTITFDNTAQRDCVLAPPNPPPIGGLTVSVHGITVANTYNRFITIDGGATLRVRERLSQVNPPRGSFQLAGGTFEVVGRERRAVGRRGHG